MPGCKGQGSKDRYGKVLLWEGGHMGSAHGMGEGGSVCLARPMLGEGVSAHGAGGCGVENRRQGGV